MEAGFIPAGPGAGLGGGMQGPPLFAPPPPAPVVRAPGLKRGKMEEAISDRIKLETVFGLTVGSNAALDCDPNTELVAYPAGCTVVLYNARKNRQTHVVNTARKSVTCVAFSPDGRYLATGECGHAPAARVWDLQDPTASGAVQIAEFPGHTHGVSCVSFSTSSKYLVSVGSQHDMIVNVWDWRANLKLASNKVSSRVKAVSFSESGNYFVTVGFRHVKFWYLEYSRNAKIKEPVPLMGRSAILGEQKDNEFCDVACGRGDTAQSTFAITRGGLLAEFNARRLLDKWVELRTTSANCMAIGSRYIVVGCAEGIVRVFEPRTLHYVTTLPRTHYLGADVALGTHISHMFNVPPAARYPDAVALTYDERNHKLTAVYNDHSLYVWDVRDIKRVGKSHSALYHSACIWGVEMVSGAAAEGEGEALPPGTFLTCSSDDTVRAWHLKPSAPNIYSNELTKVMYIDPELKFLTDADLTSAADKDKAKTYDDKTGVRCVRVSWDGAHVAAGDRAGNVWVHAASGRLLATLEAHDAEVLCLEYSPPPYTPRLLATASRDRLIHVFLVDKGYQILQTLDEHSSSITAVRFLPPAPPPSPTASAATAPPLQMVSCGADKTILFRQLKTSPDGSVSFARGLHAAGRCTLYDMEVEAGGRHVLAACQDRNVRVYSAQHARHTKTFRGTPADDGTLIKVALDSSGIYLATSSTDKLLSVYDYYSGELMATMYGHSEIATGLKFTADCQHLISAAGDGCVFVWRVPHDMVVTMRARLAQQAMRHGRRVGSVTNGGNGVDSDDSAWGSRDGGDRVTPDLTLRVGKLPSWAAKSLGDGGGGGGGAAPPALAPTPPAPARGKWAQRIQPHEKRADSDGSKDSSLDSGTDTLYAEKRQQTKQDHESTEHDGDIEDISDGERTSSSERGSRPTYYPGNNDDGTSFMVNAMDAEELRASVRRGRRGGGAGGTGRDPPAASLSGSPHDSDDEVSTPSGDAERGVLSGSCESLDAPPAAHAHGHAHGHTHTHAHAHGHTHSRREMLLKTAFDSLSTTDLHTQHGHKSLSSQHRAPAAPRSSQGQGHSKVVDPEAARRREELNRRILETRRQLESVAYRSHLKSSQSTTDLSYIPEKEGRRRPVSMAVSNNTRHHGFTPEDTLDSLNSNFYDSLNPTPNYPLDYRNKNPYAIPANLKHKIPEYLDNAPPYVPPHGNPAPAVKERKNTNFLPYNKPVIFKEERPQKPLAFTVEMGNNKPIQSKVFNRLFRTKDSETPKIPPRNFQLNLSKNPEQDRPQKTPKGNARSILKNYKSCPVSPVSEECKWSDKSQQIRQQKPNTTSLDPKKRNSLSFFIGLDGKCLKDNGKSIVDSIKSDTEKMISEITKKYGDLDEYDVSAHEDLDLHPTKENLRDDGNFSSDSLEDCSLSQGMSCKNKLYSKKVCKKHAKTKSLPRRSVSNYEISEKPAVPVKPSYITNQKSSTLPRNMPSNLEEIIDVEDLNRNPNYMYRCQSVLTKRCVTQSNESVLSDTSNGSSVSNEIFMKYGNEVAFQQAKYDSRYNLDSQNCSFENINEPDAKYLDNHRHSSASFFLNQKKYMKPSCSQESILSEDMYLDENQLSRTNCNSLESVLSDDSECTKSAPLEMLFEGSRAKLLQKNQSVNISRNSKSCYEFDNTSKSYGSSPNTVPSFASQYIYSYLGTSPNSQQKVEETVSHKPGNKVYGFDVPTAETNKAAPEFGHRTVTRSKSVHDSTQPPPAKNIAYYFDGSNVQAYTKATKDEIPRLNTAFDHGNTSKSLHPEFTDKYKSTMDGCEPKTMVKSKSCSFEVVLEPASKPNPIKNLIEKRNSHVQKNLEKFEEQIRKNQHNKVNKNQSNTERANSKLNATKSLERGSNHKNNSKITMEFVPHKPPKPAKRTSSVKLNNRLKAVDKPTLSSSISSQYKAKLDGLHNKNFLAKRGSKDNNSNVDTDTVDRTEKTFDIFVKEKDVNENRSEIQMDSLEVYALQRMERMKQLSLDSLDILEDANDFAKDSLDYYSEQKNKNPKCLKEQNNIRTKTDAVPSHSRDSKENIAPLDEIKKYKHIERKLQIINKLVEMEERKILQEKVLKEWRMRPLKANINDGKGVVKVLSRKFEKLAKKQTVPNFTSLTLEEADTDTENSENKEIKRNLSLPDILDSDQIGVISTSFNNDAEIGNESGNMIDGSELGGTTKPTAEAGNQDSKATNPHVTQNLNNTVKETSRRKFLKHRVHNEMVYPKTDVHLDSENYESSTTSSSCTNSPKRITFYGFNRLKTPFRKVIRIPTPRLCMARGPEMLSLPRSPLKRAAVPIPALAKTQARPLAPSDGEEEGGMRRAISLSDLAKPTPAPRGTAATKLSPAACAGVGAVKSPSGFLRPAPRHAPKGNMTRSSSVGVLNHSDSESDGGDRRGVRGGGGGVPAPGGAGLMRPTISSLNKQAQAARRRAAPHAHSHSQASLSTGQQESSSDADEAAGRAAIDTRMGRSGSERDLSAKAREVTARLAAPAARPRVKPAPASAPAPAPDPDHNLSGPELCAMLTAQLVGAARRVAALHRSLRRAPPHPAHSAPHPALTELEAAILETQRVLRGAVGGGGGRSNGDGSPDPDSGGEAMDAARQRLSNLVSSSDTSAHPAMALIDQYSDILLNMMQNKMVPPTNSQPDHSPHS